MIDIEATEKKIKRLVSRRESLEDQLQTASKARDLYKSIIAVMLVAAYNPDVVEHLIVACDKVKHEKNFDASHFLRELQCGLYKEIKSGLNIIASKDNIWWGPTVDKDGVIQLSETRFGWARISMQAVARVFEVMEKQDLSAAFRAALDLQIEDKRIDFNVEWRERERCSAASAVHDLLASLRVLKEHGLDHKDLEDLCNAKIAERDAIARTTSLHMKKHVVFSLPLTWRSDNTRMLLPSGRLVQIYASEVQRYWDARAPLFEIKIDNAEIEA